VRVIEKPRQVRSRLKGVGIYLFDVSVFDAIRRTPRTALRDEYELTDSVQAMIDDGEPVRPAVVVHEEYNLSNPGDLLRCNLEQARRERSGAVMGPNCTVHPDAVVMNSVLGANVTIEHPIAVANSLIFDGTRIRDRGSLNHVIVTPKLHVECSRFLGDGEPIRAGAGRG
jgi:dTDP-glucose pyrophosphorylase